MASIMMRRLVFLAGLCVNLIQGTCSMPYPEANEEENNDISSLEDLEILTKLVRNPEWWNMHRYVRKRSFHRPKPPAKVQCEAPDNTLVVETQSQKVVKPQPSKETECALFKVPVRITAERGTIPLPSYILIHRCMGSPNAYTSADVKQCTVTKKDNITVQYYDLNHALLKIRNAIMSNHTECKEDCIVKRQHCDPVTQVYRPQYCDCACIIDQGHCGKDHVFKQFECKCECILHKHCPGVKEWQRDKCMCGCPAHKVQSCLQWGHDYTLDNSTCQCVRKTIRPTTKQPTTKQPTTKQPTTKQPITTSHPLSQTTLTSKQVPTTCKNATKNLPANIQAI